MNEGGLRNSDDYIYLGNSRFISKELYIKALRDFIERSGVIEEEPRGECEHPNDKC